MSPLYIYMDLSNAPSSDCFSQLQDGSSSPRATGAAAAAAADSDDVLHRPPGLREAAAAAAALKIPPPLQRFSKPRPPLSNLPVYFKL